MNKRELQNYAEWAKENLETQIKVSLNLMGIYSDKDIKQSYVQGDLTVIEGESRTYPKSFNDERKNIVRIIRDEGYDNVVEQFAYTWFNRIIALRFMEVHEYLDHGFKIFPDDGLIEPQILSNLRFVEDDLDLDVNHYTKLKNEDNIEELYRYVLFKQCNSLSRILPMLFSNEYSYLEYLLPPVLLTGETIITRLIELDKEDFLNDIEVIGWLYQYYVSHLREGLRKNRTTTKDDIPILSQVFTPEWIVKYMAENSIGRIWLESYPNSSLKEKFKYYVEEAEQTEEVNKKLEEIRYKNVNPEHIRVIEPCAGSGHILVYSFDLLFKMYEEAGYLKTDIPKLILENNLVGLDIDKRATQLAQFSLMMKARSIDPRFFNDGRRVIPKVLEIKESKKLYRLEYKKHLKDLMDTDWKRSEYNLTNNDLSVIDYVVKEFEEAKVIGSLLKIKPSNAYLGVGNKINQLRRISIGGVFSYEFIEYGLKRISEILRLAHFMSMKYDVMITNPPYLSISKFDSQIKKYFNKYYSNSKRDMFSMFMEVDFVKKNGFKTLVNPDSWMFLKSFTKLRESLLTNKTILNMTHHGMGEFDAVVQTTSFIIRNINLKHYKSIFYRLINYSNKEDVFLNRINEAIYATTTVFLKKLPESIFAYWVSVNVINTFGQLKIDDKLITREGMVTADNNRFLRFWQEVDINKICFNCKSIEEMTKTKIKWIPYTKGGNYRKWYGNNEYIVNWENDGYEIRNNIDIKTGRIRSHNYNGKFSFLEGLTWTSLSSGSMGVRYSSEGFLFDSKGAKGFASNYKELTYIIALLNSCVGSKYLSFLSPTIDYKVGDIVQIPLLLNIGENVLKLVDENILLSKNEWDSFETSWEFKKHPLVKISNDLLIEGLFNDYLLFTTNNFNQLKQNEEELNEYFINLYGLQDELTKEVEDRYVSISIADKERDIKSLVSYFVGVLMGRYSLVEEGLIFAGGDFDNTRYGKYEVDKDGIIPLYPKLGMEDNLTEKIINLIIQVYGEETYSENIDFIAEALGKRQNETSEETLNRYLYNNFYNDHVRMYQKTPIYWMFSSGKDNGFKGLIYLHRYTEDTLAMINSMYLLPETTRLKNEIEDLETQIKTSDGPTQRRLEREKDFVSKQYYEAVEYGYVLDHMANRYIKIDLDDGVKVNYAKFQGIEIVNESGTKIKKDLLVPMR